MIDFSFQWAFKYLHTGVTQSDQEDQLLLLLIEWVSSPGKIGKHLGQYQMKPVESSIGCAVICCYMQVHVMLWETQKNQSDQNIK